MIGTILHTDMARHEEMLKALTVKAADQSTVSAAFTLEVLCHVADLGNCAIGGTCPRLGQDGCARRP